MAVGYSHVLQQNVQKIISTFFTFLDLFSLFPQVGVAGFFQLVLLDSSTEEKIHQEATLNTVKNIPTEIISSVKKRLN